MAVVLNRITNGYNYVFEELADPRVKPYLFMSSPLPIICLICSYVYFVKKLGPQFMENRKPFKLEKVIIVYNFIQIIACFYLVIMAIKYTLFQYNIFCEPVDYSETEIPARIAKHVWFYFMIKVTDMIDSVFFVLRKKNENLSFLHVYHHAGMTILGWIGTKYLAGGHSVFFGVLNSIVHMVMYFYYLLSVWDEKYKKNIWWKKHITQLQMAQFVILALYFIQMLFQPNCKFPKWTIWVLVPQNVFMTMLFTNFYFKTYVNKPKPKPKTPISNGCNGQNGFEHSKIKTQ